jgi:hypothetical protein
MRTGTKPDYVNEKARSERAFFIQEPKKHLFNKRQAAGISYRSATWCR